MLAKGIEGTTSKSYYLYTGTDYMLGSPFYLSLYYGENDGANISKVSSVGSFYEDWVDPESNPKPSVYINHDLIRNVGNDTATKPYTLTLN